MAMMIAQSDNRSVNEAAAPRGDELMSRWRVSAISIYLGSFNEVSDCRVRS